MKKIMLYAVLLLLVLGAIGSYNLSQAKPSSSSAKAAGSGSTASKSSHTTSNSSTTQQMRVSQVIKRIDQLAPAQYATPQEHDTWAYSACSAAAMTEYINALNVARGIAKQYRITDILAQEVAAHAITPELGLLEPAGIDRTVARFGLKATWLNTSSVADLVAIANQGIPVIVGFPPETLRGGHLLIVKGGDAQEVTLVDSSSRNWPSLSYADFQGYWRGFAVTLTPAKGGQQ